MIARFSVALAIVVSLSACRPSGPGMALGGPNHGMSAEAASHARQPMRARQPELHRPEKSMGDRIMAAMALERVTGLQPDPARFLDNH